MKESMGRIAGVVILAGILCGATSGCAWSVGGGQKGGSAVITPTRGQELIDLKKAHEAGALTDEEYERMKAEIVD